MVAKITPDIFFERSKKKHSSKYTYEKSQFKELGDYIVITCPEHGDFEQSSTKHLYGSGCRKCAKNNPLDTQDIINAIKPIYKNNYDYNSISFEKTSKKIKIICKKHGQFYQYYYQLTKGNGCKECRLDLLKSKYTNEVHDKIQRNQPNQVKIIDIDIKSQKVKATCKKHGQFFFQKKKARKEGVILCQKCKRDIDVKKIVSKIKKTCNQNKYKIKPFKYTGNKMRLQVMCPVHGWFYTTPNNLLSKKRCKKCGIDKSAESRRKTFECFKRESKLIHGEKYSYSKTHYTDRKEKTKILCKQHGEFWQSPHNHLRGKGCPSCNTPKSELKMEKILKRLGIKFDKQKQFDSCRNDLTGRLLRFDFYLPDYDVLVELDGPQHFFKDVFFNLNKLRRVDFKDILRKDRIKNRWAKKNQKRILRIPFTKFEQIEDILRKELKIYLDDSFSTPAKPPNGSSLLPK